MGLIPKIFKKSDIPPDVVPVLEEDSGSDNELSFDDDDDAEVVSTTKSNKRVHSKGAEISTSLERLQVQMEALNVNRGATSERFTRMSEQIGELRSMIINSEQKMKSIDVTATRAADLVQEVQPDQLAKDVMKIESKTEQLKTKMQGQETITTDLIKEIKDIKNLMRVYKGTETVLKLNEDVKAELISIQKMKAATEMHSDKVEKMFVEMQKGSSELERFKNIATGFENSQTSMQKSIEELRLMQKTKANRKDILSLDQKTEAKILDFSKQLNKIDQFQESVDGLSNITEGLTDLSSKNKQSLIDFGIKLTETSNNNTKLLHYLKKLTGTVNSKAAKTALTESQQSLTKALHDIKDLARMTNNLISMVDNLKHINEDTTK